MVLLSLLACGPNIASLYEAERKHALTVASTAPEGWEPDLIVSAGIGTLETLVRVQLDGALEELAPPRKGAGLGTITPNLKVKHVSLTPSDVCDACLQLRVELGGDVSTVLLGARLSTGVEGMVKGQVELGVQEGRRVVVQVRQINKVELGARDFDPLGLGSIDSLFGAQVRSLVAAALPPIPVVDLAATTLPVRLLRVKRHEEGVRVEVLTDVPGATAARIADVGGERLRLGVSESALTGLVRRAAFERGLLPELDMGIDPRRLDVEGDRFTLDLRLWRLVGAGWWRDYTAAGTLGVADGQLRLDVTKGSVKETGASPGAGLVDPLAALFQSEVLKAIAQNLDRSLPAATGSKNSGLRARTVATAVRGEGDTLVVDAELRTAGASR